MISITLHGASIELPDPLEFDSGERVTTAAQWRELRRPQLLELFRREVYGRAPVESPVGLTFETESITPDALGGLATRKRLKISYPGRGGNGQGCIQLVLFIPNTAAKPAATFLLINYDGDAGHDPETVADTSFWPVYEIVARGYATASFVVGDLDPDRHDDFKNGVHGLFDNLDEPRALDAWGAIAAWAWGASRCMDYLQTDPNLDASKVAVIGHSRAGKTALWAAAQDERFALVVSNNSGCSGAAITRGKVGEDLAHINTVFPHWFNENYKTYNGRETELLLDQHELLALIAPRLLYVTSATNDQWADPVAEYASCVAASPVYELFGLEGVPDGDLPTAETPVHEGQIGYHLRTGDHDLTAYDWGRVMDFVDGKAMRSERVKFQSE